MARSYKLRINCIGEKHDYSKHSRISQKLKIYLTCIIFLSLMLSGCDDAITNVGKLFVKEIPTPTPYLTPLPSQTYIYEAYVCGSSEGSTYLFEAELAYYPFDTKLRKQVSEAKRQDILPLLDEIRDVHSELVELEAPVDCPILIELDYALESETSTAISAFTAFYNGEKEEVWMGLLKTMLEYNKQVESLLDQIYFRK